MNSADSDNATRSLGARAGRIWRPLAADIRQAIVGWLVLLAIPLVGALLLVALAGQVPAWTLAIVLAVATVLVAAISLEHRRELGRAEGALTSERERRGNLEVELAAARAESDPIARSTAREGFLFRIDTLREEVIDRRKKGASLTGGQIGALRNLAADLREQCGPSATVDQVMQDWESPIIHGSTSDASAALGQLRGIAMSASITSRPNAGS